MYTPLGLQRFGLCRFLCTTLIFISGKTPPPVCHLPSTVPNENVLILSEIVRQLLLADVSLHKHRSSFEAKRLRPQPPHEYHEKGAEPFHFSRFPVTCTCFTHQMKRAYFWRTRRRKTRRNLSWNQDVAMLAGTRTFHGARPVNE